MPAVPVGIDTCLPSGVFDHPALNEVICLFTVVDVQEAYVSGLHHLEARNDLHVGTGEISSLQFHPIGVVLRVRRGSQDTGEQKAQKIFHAVLPTFSPSAELASCSS